MPDQGEQGHGEQDSFGSGAPGGHVAGETADTRVASATIAEEHNHGRPSSWVAISLVIAGFLVGAIAMFIGTGGPLWPVFWAGAGIALLGLLISVATNTFADWY